MSWTDIFPVLTDEQIDQYHNEATAAEKAQMENWYGVERIINAQAEKTHIVSVSLFWKNVRVGDPELPTPTREKLQNAVELGLAERFNPWDHYILPLIELTPEILKTHPSISVRVYLANDLAFLADELAEAGNEVYLMKSSSINFAPGGLWRFLPFSEEGRMVTVTDTDRLDELATDLERTEIMRKVGVGAWRVPVPRDLTPDYRVCYLPFMGCQFGVKGGVFDVRELLDAFTWQCLHERIEPTVNFPNCGPLPIQSSVWPSYGFDEFFMTIAAYPRIALDGMITFVPGDTSSQLLMVDVEYCTWGNPASELVFFPSGSCCGQLPTGAKASYFPTSAEPLPDIEPFELGSEPKIAFLFLTRKEVNHPEIWREYFQSNEGESRIFAHVAHPEKLENNSFLKEHVIDEYLQTEWGDISLVRATLALLRAALTDSDCTHMVLVSESCVPVRSLSDLTRSLQLDPRSRMFVRSWEDERRTNVLRAQRVEYLDGIRKEIAHFQAQWMSLCRNDAELICNNDLTDHFLKCFAPDEAYFATALAVLGRPPLQSVANRHFTWTDWTQGGDNPGQFHEVSPELAARISDSGCFFARKFKGKSNIGDYSLHL